VALLGLVGATRLLALVMGFTLAIGGELGIFAPNAAIGLSRNTISEDRKLTGKSDGVRARGAVGPRLKRGDPLPHFAEALEDRLGCSGHGSRLIDGSWRRR
jgi:hypothetical protein